MFSENYTKSTFRFILNESKIKLHLFAFMQLNFRYLETFLPIFDAMFWFVKKFTMLPKSTFDLAYLSSLWVSVITSADLKSSYTMQNGERT